MDRKIRLAPLAFSGDRCHRVAMKLGEYTKKRTPYIVAAALDDVDLSVRTAERRHIEKVMGLVGGNITLAARLLRLSRRSLERKGYRRRY